jgi:hypothetical protein
MARSSRPDAEGYFYFAKMPSGTLFGPYHDRGTAAGVLTQMSQYYREPRRIYDYLAGDYIDNPRYNPNALVGEVLKAKLGAFEKAPKLSLHDKYVQAIAKLERLTQMLNDRGIDVDFD